MSEVEARNERGYPGTILYSPDEKERKSPLDQWLPIVKVTEGGTDHVALGN